MSINLGAEQDFQDWCRDFQEELLKFQNITARLQNASGSARSSVTTEAEQEISEIKELLERLEFDKRSYPGKLKNRATRELRQRKMQFEEQQNRYHAVKLGGDGRGSGGSSASRRTLVGQQSTVNASGQSIDNTLNILGEITDVGGKTYDQLQSQTEQLRDVDSNMDDMEGSLAQSLKTIKRMHRRLATSKMLRALIIVLEVGIIALIVWLKYFL